MPIRILSVLSTGLMLLLPVNLFGFGGGLWQKRDVGLQIFAGQLKAEAMIDGPVGGARFREPRDVAVNAAGDIFVVDSNASVIRKISNGVVSTFAGRFGIFGHADGTGQSAKFSYPTGITIDSSGNLFVTEGNNHTIRKITPAGVVTTVAGAAGNAGSANGTGSAARFNSPEDITVASDGNFYISDKNNNMIRKMTPAGVVTTFAGATSGSCGDGTGMSARFSYPTGIVADSAGNIFVSSSSCRTIRKITPAGVVTTFAGQANVSGSDDGTGSAATFNWPQGLAIDSSDNLYVSDTDNTAIRKITPSGVVTSFAGTYGVYGSADGTGAAAQFSSPTGIAADASGNLFLTDSAAMTVRKISPSRVVTLVAGTHNWDGDGSADGAASSASFNDPDGIAADAAGNFYIADTDSGTIRKVSSAGVVTTIAGSPGLTGADDGTGSAARFQYPTFLTVAEDGNIYVADEYRIRKVTPAGVVTTLAGGFGVSGTIDGTGAAAQFGGVAGIVSDGAGNLYVGDAGNYTVRKVTLSGVVTTFAGQAGFQGSADGNGTSAMFTRIAGLGRDSSGNIFVADVDNQLVRKITASGDVTTLAGTAGDMGDTDGTGGSARFSYPQGIVVDPSGNIYLTQSGTSAIRKITQAGVVTTIAGITSSNPAYTGSISNGGRNSEIGLARQICVVGRKLYFVGDDVVKWIPRP